VTSLPTLGGDGPVFRPNSTEVWYILGGRLQGVQSGAVVRSTSGARLALSWIAGSSPRSELLKPGRLPNFEVGGSLFTSDGRWWVYYAPEDDHVHLGDADRPDSSDGAVDLGSFHLVSGDPLVEIPGTRWLLARPAPGTDRVDLAVLDLDTLVLRPLGDRVTQTMVLGRRVLALLDKLNDWWAPGTLVSIDIATGAHTVLAPNVTDYAVSPACPGCDPGAPGAELLYVVQARVPFRYDGVWRAALP
jgi:hypothetical protein